MSSFIFLSLSSFPWSADPHCASKISWSGLGGGQYTTAFFLST